MILIKKIEYIETDRDPVEIFNQEPLRAFVPVGTEHGPDIESVEVISELVRGRRFCRPSDGIDITIGMTREAQYLLSMDFCYSAKASRIFTSYKYKTHYPLVQK